MFKKAMLKFRVISMAQGCRFLRIIGRVVDSKVLVGPMVKPSPVTENC